jgi:hypothetical protein
LRCRNAIAAVRVPIVVLFKKSICDMRLVCIRNPDATIWMIGASSFARLQFAAARAGIATLNPDQLASLVGHSTVRATNKSSSGRAELRLGSCA